MRGQRSSKKAEDAEVAKLERKVARLEKKSERLEAQNEALREQLRSLQMQLEEYRQKLFKKNKGKGGRIGCNKKIVRSFSS